METLEERYKHLLPGERTELIARATARQSPDYLRRLGSISLFASYLSQELSALVQKYPDVAFYWQELLADAQGIEWKAASEFHIAELDQAVQDSERRASDAGEGA